MSGTLVCPYCGKDFDAHAGDLCPVLDASMTKQIRAVVQLIQTDRDEKLKQLALSTVAPPRLARITNGVNDIQQLLNANFDRGAALVYNDDAADVFLGIDKQHLTEADKRFLLKTKNALTFTSPTELWCTGNAAGPQNVYVWDLPPGRQSADVATLAKLA